jgi:hypothetical protein
LVFLLPLSGISYLLLPLLPFPLFHNLQLCGFSFLDYPCYGVVSSVYLFCRLLVTVLFCCSMRPLHQQICWLLPLAQLLFLALFFLSLPPDLSGEVRPKKHLLFVRRRRLLLSF